MAKAKKSVSGVTGSSMSKMPETFRITEAIERGSTKKTKAVWRKAPWRLWRTMRGKGAWELQEGIGPVDQKTLTIPAMSNERPIVVAPRPVRLATLFTRKQDSEFSFIADITTEPPDRSSRPPSAAALPPETLDEFLSILRPSFLRKPRSVTFPSLRQFPRVDSRADIVTYDPCRKDNPSLNPSPTQFEYSADIMVAHPDPDARQWFSSTLLASPISRFHTRNPFQRNCEGSPVPPSPLSPAAIPLPTPSPTELLENI